MRTLDRRLPFAVLIALLTGGFSTASAADQAVVVASCTQTVIDYAYHRDRWDAEAIAALFTPDGELHIQGQVFRGRDAIRERLRSGAGSTVSRHMMTTIRISPEPDGSASGVSYAAVVIQPPPEGYAGETLEFAYVGIADYLDEFDVSDGACLIARREMRIVFTRDFP